MHERLRKRLFWCGALLLVCVFVYRLQDLFNRDMRSRLVGQTADACIMEDACLFQKALASRLIQSDKNYVLNVVPADSRLPSDKAVLLERLYFSPPGVLIQKELHRWNATRKTASVRDNTAGENSGLWQAYEYRQQNPVPQRFLIDTTDRVSESFGFVHNGRLRPGFGDWVAATGVDFPVLFHGRLSMQKQQRVQIQYVGRLLGAQGRAAGINEPLSMHIEPACDPDYAQNCTRDNAAGGLLTLELAGLPLPARVDMELTLQSVVNRSLQEDGLRIAVAGDTLTWREQSQPPRSGQSFHLTTAFGLRLTNEMGQANACAEQLGLVPVVGVDRDFVFSLNGLFAQSRLPPGDSAIELSVDPYVQKHAQDSLTAALNPKRNRKQHSAIADRFERQRRAALLILDADTGAILGAAGWPALPQLRQLTAWDIRAYHKIYERNGHVSPLEVQAWQSTTRDNTPGSIFKPLVALSAASALSEHGNKDFLRRFIQGVGRDEWHRVHAQGRFPELPIQQGFYTPLPDKGAIANFGNTALSGYFNDNHLGLREAVQHSINTWFVKLALEVDGDNAGQIDRWREQHRWRALRDKPLPERQGLIAAALQQYPLALAQTMFEFGFTGSGSGLVDTGDFPAVQWPLETYSRRVLHSAPAVSDLTNTDFILNEALEWPLAQSAIGQAGIQVTPLHVALIFGSIGSEHRIHARLIRRIGAGPSREVSFPRMEIEPSVLRLLKLGLKAVPQEGGTAETAFRRHEDTVFIYGKTGTAQVTPTQTNTVWFVGWREPKGEAEPRRLAFACMITHVKTEGTGGGLCAPIVAEFFTRLNKEAKPELRACSRKD